ncbi:MAG TPA: antibiotic biosynthesis monooxygenase [Gammaproteobacteria bacterium]|nr:antibiotic biosynthesis monooxygenase [Gammaproteobacteria bacterium]|tara:strand:- start:1784 stop:2077 length:294 start_codon:yes stop_codon:yes gene_type:complete
MTCQVILDIRVKEALLEDFRSWMRRTLPETRAYDGCNNLYIVQNQDDPLALVVIEQWDTRLKYEKYLAWRTETGVVDELVAMLDGEPTFRFFDYFGV